MSKCSYAVLNYAGCLVRYDAAVSGSEWWYMYFYYTHNSEFLTELKANVTVMRTVTTSEWIVCTTV